MVGSIKLARSLLAALVIVAAALPAFASERVLVNWHAPLLDVQQVLQAPEGCRARWDALRGKVVVLEFWATWCPTCVKSIPHLNALADELKNKDVQFISITDEDSATVKSFLAHHPIRGWVGLNPTGTMFKSYGIEGRPITFVVRPDGTIDAAICPYTSPFPVRAQNLLNLLEGKPSGLVSSRVVYAGEVHDDAGRPIAGVSVRANGITSDDSFWRIGDTITDKSGRFTIDRQIPPAFVDQNPIRIEFVHPNYLYARLEDLRVLSADEQTHLHIGLLDGNTITGTVLDSGGAPIPHALVQAILGTSLSDRQSATTDAKGAFTMHGLPSRPVNLRVFARSPGLLLQTDSVAVDLTSSTRSATIRVSPLVPAGAELQELLGMKVVETDSRLQARLWLDHPAILVLDPGAHSERLGMGPLHAGDCFWGADGKTLITDVAGFSNFIVRRFREVQHGRPVRLVCGLQPWGDISITAMWDKLQLTNEDLVHLGASGRPR